MSLCINPDCEQPNNLDNKRFCLSCGSELLLAGKYLVRRLLSNKGGFATTYQVLDNNTPKVLKVLNNNQPKSVELFQKEAQVLKQLNQPGIPKGEGSFIYFPRNSQTPLHCLVMEFIEGIDLEDYQSLPIQEKLALDWLYQLANILHTVHSHKFFHRDIKPSNIILKPNGQLVLIDFGAVRHVTATIKSGGKNTGIYTPGYAPLEQERGYAVPQSDFFALGRTMVYLLTGSEPADLAVYNQYNYQFKWRKQAPQISRQLADFIDELMAEKVEKRPANSAILLRKVEELRTKLLPVSLSHSNNNPPIILKYAGFWNRFQASIIDTVIVTILVAVIGGITGYILSANNFFDTWGVRELFTRIPLGEDNLVKTILIYSLYPVVGTTVLGFIIVTIRVAIFLVYPVIEPTQAMGFIFPIVLGGLIKWVYFTGMEFAFQATIGKIILGMSVTSVTGQRMSIIQANKRYWAKILSLITLYVGYLVTGWNKNKQALHDLIAGTIVVKKR